MDTPLSPDLLEKTHAYFRAANYLSVGQIYLMDNPLLHEKLQPAHIKPRLLGHWGTTPGLNFIYVHLNRIITEQDASLLFVAGPGHGGPALVANVYLEGTYSEVYPHVSRDIEGMRALFKQFSFPGGVPSHVAPETPGSIHEGGELGYALAHAYGAAFDHPDLVVACVVGDGEAETGPLAASWHSNKFLNPARDGAVLPILHLNGFKISGPTVLANIPEEELISLFRGYGYEPFLVEGDDLMEMHQKMASTLECAFQKIRSIQQKARKDGFTKRAAWPMIILRTPKGWTGPKEIDGQPVEGAHLSHQVPIKHPREEKKHLAALEKWMKSYKPEELFDAQGAVHPDIAALAPKGEKRMGANPHANGGTLLKDLHLPDFRSYAVDVKCPGTESGEATRVQGAFLRDVLKMNRKEKNFRLFSPDETQSNRWGAVFEETSRLSSVDCSSEANNIAPDGRVLEVLSEHLCEGWLEGYLLTGRHGFFSCYEAFIHIIDSMFNQHAKWLKVSRRLPWRKPIASLNILLTSHVWRQDHNGFSHQDPGFIDHLVNKKAEVIRIYLPPDANTLLSVTDHCMRSRNYVNLIIAGKQPEPQWLTMEEATQHCTKGLGVWQWASNDGGNPDVVMACAGDVPTIETLAAVEILRSVIPEIKIRVINVVDLMTLQPNEEHPHGLTREAFDELFTTKAPIIFAFHGYPWLIHRLTYRHHGHANLHVRGYKEEGTTTTPFDMVVRNDLDRFHLVQDAVRRMPQFADRAEEICRLMEDKLRKHKEYIETHGDDLPEIRDWKWGQCMNCPK
ncbi:phosphoketolase [Candidatus Peregrinibacteria bacterium CG10_big_fil_rev_8_21_14_0_10_49_16]|nr:MAG: phosphoketolase [Candidatus Peregrinibacteria bacterium CG22_combo_CG10-13_8_21_14_all_49_11]PIR52163.1 MAG: phosphoketolase [Candidatus Peregrinibacteria bacterium CG10_big_fil_rev_8_21_14_0_10_49_16]